MSIAPNREPGRPRPFYMGFSKKIPKALFPFLMVTFALFVSGFAAIAMMLSASQGDPGPGRFSQRYQTTGILELHPFPVLRLPAGENGEPATTLMMSGQGKRGVLEEANGLDGKAVSAQGVLLKRGEIEMLQIGGKMRLVASDEVAAYTPAPRKQLGKWRLTGEICDGKCNAGAMRPGRGLAHKACANFCMIGGIPPVFVSTGPVAGSTFFLLADKNGNVLDERIYDLTALMIEVEGEVERLDNLNVLKMDIDTVRKLR